MPLNSASGLPCSVKTLRIPLACHAPREAKPIPLMWFSLWGGGGTDANHPISSSPPFLPPSSIPLSSSLGGKGGTLRRKGCLWKQKLVIVPLFPHDTQDRSEDEESDHTSDPYTTHMRGRVSPSPYTANTERARQFNVSVCVCAFVHH